MPLKESQFPSWWRSKVTDEEYDYLVSEGLDSSQIGQGFQYGFGRAGQGYESGSNYGPWGGLIGGLVGGTLGTIEAFMNINSVIAEALEGYRDKKEIEDLLGDIGSFSDHMQQQLAGMLHPLEQQFRTRARLYGAQARAQGLTGAQALAAQLEAERMYREAVGAQLPAVYEKAAQAALNERQQALSEAEVKANIILAERRSELEKYLVSKETASNIFGGVLGASATGFANQEAAASEAQRQQQEQQVGAEVGGEITTTPNPEGVIIEDESEGLA